MKFILEIELGNDAVVTCDDVANLLYDVRQNLQGNDDKMVTDSVFIRDHNGNTVGKWEVTE